MHRSNPLSQQSIPFLAVAFLPVFVGCVQQQSQSLDGAPNGTAEILTVDVGDSTEIQHTEGDFLDLVRQPGRVVLVDFWGPHCGPCVYLAPELEEIADKYPDTVSVVKVDLESSINSELGSFFGINAIPAMRIFVDGQPAGAILGFAKAKEIDEYLKPALAMLQSTSGS